MADVKWGAPTNRTTGLSSTSINAGANVLSNEIDNAANLDRFLDLDLVFTCATAAAAFTVVEVYILYAVDGTNFEDGGTSVDPAKVPVGVFSNRNVTTAQRVSLAGVPITPHKFKVLLKSELDQNASSVTLLARTYGETVS